MAHHQLSNGMLVSGPPPKLTRGGATSSSCKSPYTSGDAKNSGEFAKMFGIPSVEYSASAALSRSAHSSGIKITPRTPSPIPTTGLIVSGDSSRRRARHGEAVTVVEGGTFEYGVSKAWKWLVKRSIRSLPDYPFDGPTDLPIGQLVKITGHVTCGSIPLETSGHEGIGRCVYASTQLYARRRRRWRLTSSEKLVADFYISDSSTGMRFLVRAGHGAKVTPFVESAATVLEINREENTQSWLKEQKQLRLKECYIREGDSASVIGVLRTNKDLLIVDPPSDSDLLSTGCKWWRCMFPFLVRGLILIGKESSDEVIYRV